MLKQIENIKNNTAKLKQTICLNPTEVLEVIGYQTDLKVEKKIDKRYLKHCGAVLIQRVWRGHRTRLAIERSKADRLH